MILPAHLADDVLEHCRAGVPNEACGLLAGDGSLVEAVYCIDNAAPSPVSYTIEANGHFAALMDAEQRGWDIIGAFHSHIDGPAYPSATDIAQAAEPDWTWVVVGPMNGRPEMRAFRIRAGVVTEEELELAAR